MSKRVKVVKLDEDHRIYVFTKKVIYKERVNGKLVTRFSGVSLRDLLGSPLIDETAEEKIRNIMQKLG